MKELIHSDDMYQMNWIEGNTEWGTVRVIDGIEVKAESEKKGDTITERYTFINVSGKDIFTSIRDIGIYTPFNDDYTDAVTCMTKRCHTHIWCGGNIAYVMALKMSGEGKHLGLVLTEGSIAGYSVERDLAKRSNDRGDFILHPASVSLVPGESFTVAWTLFWHDGKEDFYNKLKEYNQGYIHVSAEKYLVFEGESITVRIQPAFEFTKEDVTIIKGDKPVDYTVDGETILIEEQAGDVGERAYNIAVKGIKTHCNILVMPTIEELAKRRCYFIAKKQQYNNPASGLDGAYLSYDNEEKCIHYNKAADHNGGRERVCMGILIAKYLQTHKDELLDESLKKYIVYVERELFDRETGVVYNDYQRDNSWNRLYNYPWMSVFFIELYELYHNREYLLNAYKAMKSFYAQGGAHFYAIEVPLREIVLCLDKEGMITEKEDIMSSFAAHCDYIIDNGLNYPAHEVNYEQSIVAPAANILLQMYDITKDEKYLEAAKLQVKVLEQFNGMQPDYHMYEVALRHWDGYWFGKRKLYGDTFPHYWSSLTGNAYVDFANAVGDVSYMQRAEASLRGSLSMFMPDGSASCAYVYPVSVNGTAAGFYDPYANDQDWALYYYITFSENAT